MFAASVASVIAFANVAPDFGMFSIVKTPLSANLNPLIAPMPAAASATATDDSVTSPSATSVAPGATRTVAFASWLYAFASRFAVIGKPLCFVASTFFVDVLYFTNAESS